MISHQLIGTYSRNTLLRRRAACVLPAARPHGMYVRTRSWMSVSLCRHCFFISPFRLSLFWFDAARPDGMYVRTRSWLSISLCRHCFFVSPFRLSLFGFNAQVQSLCDIVWRGDCFRRQFSFIVCMLERDHNIILWPPPGEARAFALRAASGTFLLLSRIETLAWKQRTVCIPAMLSFFDHASTDPWTP